MNDPIAIDPTSPAPVADPVAAPVIPSHIKPTDLPSPPATVLQVVQECAKPEVTSRRLSKLVTLDPVLTAELLRIVNSAYFGVSGKVKTVSHAITVIGIRTLRNMLLCVTVRDVLRAHAIPGFDISGYMDDALRRAVSARYLGEEQGLDPAECFTVGLLQDFGILALFYVNRDQVEQWPSMRPLDPDARYRMEEACFGTTHDQVAQLLADTWKMPDELAVAMAYHHRAPPEDSSQAAQALARIAYCADWMGSVFSAAEKQPVIEGCKAALAEAQGLSGDDCERLLTRVGESVPQAAVGLGMHVHDHVTFEHVMREANLRLATANLSFQELTWKLQKTLTERDRLAKELAQELGVAREIQRSLLPASGRPDYPITGLNIPARALSGDFYDFFPLPNGHIYFNLADVSGKGINSALLMAKTSSLFRCLGKAIHDPARLLETINNEIHETSIRGMFVTMVAGILAPQQGKVRLVNAGHPPALHFTSEGKVLPLAAQAPPLGIVANIQFREMNVDLKGGCLYLFSDGVTEGTLANGEAMGLQRLLKLLKEHADLSPRQRLEEVVAQLEGRDMPLKDDITLLLIEDARTRRKAPHTPR